MSKGKAFLEKEILCKWNGNFSGVEYIRRSSVCSGKSPFDPRVPFAFQPVEPDILAKWKASLAMHPSITDVEMNM